MIFFPSFSFDGYSKILQPVFLETKDTGLTLQSRYVNGNPNSFPWLFEMFLCSMRDGKKKTKQKQKNQKADRGVHVEDYKSQKVSFILK